MSAAALALRLPTADRRIETYVLRGNAAFAPSTASASTAAVSFNRIAYSAAHVVSDPLASVDPWLGTALDWDATIAYRQRLWSLGLGVAEAMDTAQRGMGLDWPTSLELIRRSLDAARDHAGRTWSPPDAGTDHLDPRHRDGPIDDVIRAYEEQVAAIEKLGGKHHPDVPAARWHAWPDQRRRLPARLQTAS